MGVVADPRGPDDVAALADLLFDSQTGVHLTTGPVVRARENTSDLATELVILAPMDDVQLRQLAAQINSKLAAGQSSEGILAAVGVLTVTQARSRLGPVPPPAGGWQPWILQNIYGGVRPGAFDTTLPVLVDQLMNRSAQSSAEFEDALLQALQEYAASTTARPPEWAAARRASPGRQAHGEGLG